MQNFQKLKIQDGVIYKYITADHFSSTQIIILCKYKTADHSRYLITLVS